MKKYAYIPLIFFIALALRLYPTLVSGLPYSTDGWGSIRNAEGLMKYSPISLDNHTIFDGYHSYWPANSLFGAVLSYATGLNVMNAMAVGIPAAGAIAIIIFYAIVAKISKNHELALFASFILAVAYPNVLFTAGVTKETYATPIYLLAILLAIRHEKWREIALFAVASAALVMSHHLLALVALAFLASLTLADLLNSFKRGFTMGRMGFIPLSILTFAVALYFGVYAYNGLKVKGFLTFSDLLSAISYQVVTFAVASYYVLKNPRPSRARTSILCFASVVIVSFTAFMCTGRVIIPGAPVLPSRYVLYAIPFIVASPLLVLGIGETAKMDGKNRLAPIFWLATLLGLKAYAIFGDSPFGFTLAYRTLNLLTVPLAILCAFGIHRLASAYKDHKMTRLSRIMAGALILTIGASNIYAVYASVVLQERYLGYFWLYTRAEFRAAEWLLPLASGHIAGDVKFQYLIKEYFRVDVDVLQGLRYLYGEGARPHVLITYNRMMENGYVVYGGYSADLPENWTQRVSIMDQVYSNGFVNVHH